MYRIMGHTTLKSYIIEIIPDSLANLDFADPNY